MLYERWDINPNLIIQKNIVEKIMKHIKVKSNSIKERNIMLKDGRIIGLNKYAKMIEEGEVSQNDAYAFVAITSEECILCFQYPFLYYIGRLLESYISKMGKWYYNSHGRHCKDYDCVCFIGYCSAPATSLRYTAIYNKYEGYSIIEVVDLEEVAKKTKVNDILKNYAEWIAFNNDTYWEIYEKFVELPLFDGYNFGEAVRIIRDYYDGNKSLANEVSRIADAYDRIFEPYRFCFETKTWNQVDCSTFRLMK